MARAVAANAANRNLLRPLEGVRYERLSAPAYAQGAAAASYLQAAYGSGNNLVIGMNALLDDLDWGPRTHAFEQAWADLACVIGFASQQPEHETGRGPDGLWAVAGRTFYVIEAKSGAKGDHRSTSPAHGSSPTRWTGSPPSTRLSRRQCPSWSTPARNSRGRRLSHGCRVVTARKLTFLRDALRKLAAELAADDAFRDPDRVSKLLISHHLTADALLDTYAQRAIAAQ